MALEKYRRGINEIAIEEHIAKLYGMIEILGCNIRMVIPAVQIPDRNQGYYSMGTALAPAKFDGAALIAGHGPRFCAKYNLARDDQERQALLNSLPKFSGSKIDWRRLTEEYRTHEYPYGLDSNQSRKLAKEWRAWRELNISTNSYVEFQGTLEALVETLPFVLNEDDTIVPGNEILLFKVKAGDREGEFVFLPCPEVMGYAVIAIDQCNYGREGLQWRWELTANVRWSTHELCWTLLGRDATDAASLDAAMERWLDLMGFPTYEAVSDAQMQVIAEQALQRLVNDWAHELDTKAIEQRTIRLDGVLQLELITPRPSSYSSEWSFQCYLLDNEEDVRVRTHFNFAWQKGYGNEAHTFRPFFYIVDDSSYDNGKIRNVFKHHDRQRARIKALLERFIHTPNESLVIEDKERPSYDR